MNGLKFHTYFDRGYKKSKYFNTAFIFVIKISQHEGWSGTENPQNARSHPPISMLIGERQEPLSLLANHVYLSGLQ